MDANALTWKATRTPSAEYNFTVSRKLDVQHKDYFTFPLDQQFSMHYAESPQTSDFKKHTNYR